MLPTTEQLAEELAPLLRAGASMHEALDLVFGPGFGDAFLERLLLDVPTSPTRH